MYIYIYIYKIYIRWADDGFVYIRECFAFKCVRNAEHINHAILN